MTFSFTSWEFWVLFATALAAVQGGRAWWARRTAQAGAGIEGTDGAGLAVAAGTVGPWVRPALLLTFSVAFYALAAGKLLAIMAAAILLNHAAAHAVHRSEGLPRRILLAVAVAFNVGLLATFKYAYFIADFVPTWRPAGWRLEQWMLPLGISFYTFQTLSYLVDVHRGRISKPANLVAFATYISFFPQLVAGPIVRAHEFLPQLQAPWAALTRSEGRRNLALIATGFVKKVVLGDVLGSLLVDPVFDAPHEARGLATMLALYGYSLQVYADFSGYTDMAKGMAGLLGIHLPENFRFPYKATTPADFWRRWHISLSTWWKDYVYIPLGGNRRFSPVSVAWLAAVLGWVGWQWNEAGGWFVLAGTALMLAAVALMSSGGMKRLATATHVLAVMVLGGLWHGAHINFLTWGTLNGLALAAWVLVAPHPLPTWAKPLTWFATFHVVVLSRIWFRAGSLRTWDEAASGPHPEDAWGTATTLWHSLQHGWTSFPTWEPGVLAGIGLLIAGYFLHFLPSAWQAKGRNWLETQPAGLLMLVWMAGVAVSTLWPMAAAKPFIYWQF